MTIFNDDKIVPTDADDELKTPPRANKGVAERRGLRMFWQFVILAAFLAIWQFAPDWPWLVKHVSFFNRIFISSPVEVVKTLNELLFTGQNNIPLVWPYLRVTVEATVFGCVIGLTLGAFFGLLFSNSPALGSISRPFIVVANSIPRVALIPIFVLLFGATIKASTVNVAIVVFFIGFFNAYEGGITINQAVIDNAKLLGAKPIDVMWSVRRPMVIAWTFAAVPNAISFGLAVAVTTELLTGIQGIGTLLLTATSNIESSLTFALIVILCVVGLIMYWGATWSKSRILHWQGK
jgi:NitT/TauT family transport system permease protein